MYATNNMAPTLRQKSVTLSWGHKSIKSVPCLFYPKSKLHQLYRKVAIHKGSQHNCGDTSCLFCKKKNCLSCA